MSTGLHRRALVAALASTWAASAGVLHKCAAHAAAHAKLDELLASPRSAWPERQDGKLNWLKAKLAKAKADATKTMSAETRGGPRRQET